MEKANRAVREAARAAAETGQAQVSPPISVPHMPPMVVWDELAEEAERYVLLLRQVKKTPQDTPEREKLESDLMDSLSHLQMHSQVLEASVVEALEENTGC
ncbi:MAG: hypothetical protein M3511_09475 [Deinococcota bacterium]|jgi:hypothetical protein|nr:hypothetical protein [Deinococcota bacterium]